LRDKLQKIKIGPQAQSEPLSFAERGELKGWELN